MKVSAPAPFPSAVLYGLNGKTSWKCLPKNIPRLYPGSKVRLKSAYIVECTGCEKDADGNIREIHCVYIPESRSSHDTSGITVKATIHWVSAAHAVAAEIRLYDRLLKVENPAEEPGDFKDHLNPDSLQIIQPAYLEPSLLSARMGTAYQFLRKGYFCLDKDSRDGLLVFNRTATLKDAWAKETKKQG